MDVESKINGQNMSYVRTLEYTRIWILRVVQYYKTDTHQGLESHNSTIKKEPQSGPARGWNPSIPQQEKELHSEGQTQQQHHDH